MDSGHIPVFGMFLALMWKLFGRSLAVSHLAMLPFVAGAVWATRKLVNHLFKTRYNGLITLFLLADATILAQFTLVSPDVWILCFFTMALYGFLREKRVLLAAASALLALTSMRGMMIVAAFLTTGLVMALFFSGEKGTGRKWPGRTMDYLLQAIPVYLPAALFAALYLGSPLPAHGMDRVSRRHALGRPFCQGRLYRFCPQHLHLRMAPGRPRQDLYLDGRTISGNTGFQKAVNHQPRWSPVDPADPRSGIRFQLFRPDL